MKLLRTSLIGSVLTALAGAAMASSGSLVEFKPQVMPVVVQVNAQGKVTDVLPSEQLTPKLRRLLVEQLDAWIVKPATVKGHPVASRFIAEVAMRAKPRKDGKYDTSFVYVKSLPMPFGGAVHWNNINGGLELTLVSDDSMVPNQTWRVRYNDAGHARISTAATHSRPQPAAARESRIQSAPRATAAMPTFVAPRPSPSSRSSGPRMKQP